MADIIDLDQFRAHLTGDVICLACRHQWTAVSPVGSTDLECPNCHLLNGVRMGPCVKHDELHWQCQCGWGLFAVTKDEIYCPACGVTQRFDGGYGL